MGKMQIIPAAFRAGLSRVEASEFVGISPTLFDELVKDGRMPQPRRANSRLIWLRDELNLALNGLPLANGSSPVPTAERGMPDDERFWERVS